MTLLYCVKKSFESGAQLYTASLGVHKMLEVMQAWCCTMMDFICFPSNQFGTPALAYPKALLYVSEIDVSRAQLYTTSVVVGVH